MMHGIKLLLPRRYVSSLQGSITVDFWFQPLKYTPTLFGTDSITHVLLRISCKSRTLVCPQNKKKRTLYFCHSFFFFQINSTPSLHSSLTHSDSHTTHTHSLSLTHSPRDISGTRNRHSMDSASVYSQGQPLSFGAELKASLAALWQLTWHNNCDCGGTEPFLNDSAFDSLQRMNGIGAHCCPKELSYPSAHFSFLTAHNTTTDYHIHTS